MPEEIKKIWEAIHALEKKINGPYYGPMIEDDDDDGRS